MKNISKDTDELLKKIDSLEANGMYVPTDAIKGAVDGQEEFLLEKLGIEWHKKGDGVQHILCPYLDHDDGTPSWRWDGNKRCAVCSCRDSKYHDIFGVIMRVNGCSFSTAKIITAIVLGLDSSIFKHAKNRQRPGNVDALLNPPADQSLENLPAEYLAHRLGINAAEVLAPTTPVAGWQSQNYYIPPSKKGEKYAIVGQYSCIAWGTTNLDGVKHGYLTYTEPYGKGKAKIVDPNDNDKTLVPKKHISKGGRSESTSGCSVFWGNPDIAETIVIAEGIETAYAVVHSHLEEVKNSTIAVAATLSTAGMGAFKPWPTTSRIVVAADMDKNGAGESAARSFCIRNHEQVECTIALREKPGDWLDVFRDDSAQAVRDGLEKAVPFVPETKEIKKLEKGKQQSQSLTTYKETYPMPSLQTMQLELRLTDAGRVMVYKFKGHDDQEQEEWLLVSSPFSIFAKLRYTDRENEYGVRVVLEDVYGKPCNLDFERGSVGRSAGTEIKAFLYAAGLRTENGGDNTVLDTIKAYVPDREITIAATPGWHTVNDELVFITPGGEVILPPGVLVDVELTRNAILKKPTVVGSLDGWKQAVHAALSAEGCPHWIIGIIAGFVGPILSLADLDSCGCNISGFTSRGKSTAQKLAVSVWSSPEIGKGLFRTFRTTDNAAESLAQHATGTILALDDLSHIEGVVVAKLLYMLAGDSGKTRLRADASLKNSYHWKTFSVFSGEKSLGEKVEESGEKWLPGMAVRFPDIDISEVNDHVAKQTIQSMENIRHHHGHAGPAFCEALLRDGLHHDPSILRQKVDEMASALAGSDGSGALTRAAKPFALLLVAGELAKAYGIIPEETQTKEAVQWAWSNYMMSNDISVLDPEEKVIQNIGEWIKERWNVTIFATNTAEAKDSRKAEGWYKQGEAVWIPTKYIMAATGGEMKRSHVGKILKNRQLLVETRDESRLAVRYVPGVGAFAAYALSFKEFGHEKVPSASDQTQNLGQISMKSYLREIK